MGGEPLEPVIADQRVPVTFVPAGVRAWVSIGSTVLDAARQAKVLIPAPCGGRGVCGSCAVKVISGVLESPDAQELETLAAAPPGTRLACRARIGAPVTIRPLSAQVPQGHEQSESSGESRLVAAVDLGTTTVSAAILEAMSGLEMGTATVPNMQASWGADIASRMTAALDGHSSELKHAAESSVIEALQAACASSQRCSEHISRLVVVANTAVASMLLGLDMSALAESPFREPYDRVTELGESSVIRDVLGAGAEARILPPLASFAGSDALAAVWGAGIARREGPSLLIDAGTNAELLLVVGGGLTVATAPAGPAFEAAHITSGGPAVQGAVREVRIADDGSVDMDVIGGPGEDPLWMCGSGLISAISELRRVGHLDASGRFVRNGPLESGFARRSGTEMIALSDRIALSQTDVRAFQLAKAAVCAGIERLLSDAGVHPEDVKEVFLAGALGDVISRRDLEVIGMLPPPLAGRTVGVGNAALAGAASVALDERLLEPMVEMGRGVAHVTLAGDEMFDEALIRAVGFP